jgi:hypothetical protein
LALLLLAGLGPVRASAEEEPGSPNVKKEAWREELPPAWEGWGKAERKEWKKGLARARDSVRKHARARETAALRAVEVAARKGTPVAEAEKMAKVGLDEGLAPADFEPLGQTVSAWTKQGLKGQELADAIHQEVQRRREERRRLHEEKKAQKKAEQRQKKQKGKQKGGHKAEEDNSGDEMVPGEEEDHGKARRAGKGSPGGKGRGKGKGKK